ncbi:MAG: cell wall protein [Oscillospiraceae bacterium]|nr:cell wall protein [Oscillospiraceae bacterium]
MRKLIIFIAALCLLFSVFQVPAFAAESYELLPVNVVYYPNHMEIRKIYETAASVDPGRIPRTSFERDNINYKCTDILREVITGNDTKPYTETKTVSSVKNDIATILGILPQTKEITTEDGFSGTLYLSTSSIKSEVSGYGITTSSVSTTRTYPNLYDMDAQQIPKSVTENGIAYMLTDIQWKTDNTYNADDYDIDSRYTATAIYSGTKTSSYIKGYTITAEYSGELCRTGVSVIRYTVIFSGTQIETTTEPTTTMLITTEPETETVTVSETILETTSNSEPEPVNSPKFDWHFLVILLAILTVVSTAYAVYTRMKKRK